MGEQPVEMLLLLGLLFLAAASLMGGIFRTVAVGFMAWRLARWGVPALGLGALVSYFW